ncbi:surface polysaccharide O-acyltransferase-like enzyme [Bradyrhizobium sp. LB7.2]
MFDTLLRATGTIAPSSRTTEARDRDLSLDFAKGALIVLVIVGHLIQYVIYRDDGFWYSPYYKSIYMFHMPLFMAISGYLSSRSPAAKVVHSSRQRPCEAALAADAVLVDVHGDS